MSGIIRHGRPWAAYVVVLALGAGGCFKKPSSVVVPMKFRPTSQLNMNTFAGQLPELRVHVGEFTDARDNREQVGENLENKNPIPIHASGIEPTQFVRDAMRDLMRKSGVPVSDDPAAADRVIAGDLQRFWTQETNTYESEIRVAVTVRDRGGRQVWTGVFNGSAERFGRSLKAENYQEVFSDAMVNMVEGMLNNAGFRDAMK
jgi:hypothetical protein